MAMPDLSKGTVGFNLHAELTDDEAKGAEKDEL